MLAGLALLLTSGSQGPSWRSELYPADWKPSASLRFEQDRLLQDWSTAGFRSGREKLPTVQGPVFRVSGADPSGVTDSTDAIQKAIDAAGKAGGVVLLPSGTFRVSVPSGRNEALRIDRPKVVLRGLGPEKTKLWCATSEMRNRTIVFLGGGNGWRTESTPNSLLADDVLGPTRSVKVTDPQMFKVGDWALVRADVTPEWVREHREDGWLGFEKRLAGLAYYRRVMEARPDGTLVFDAPIRYALKRRDRARVHRALPLLAESGIEALSIGGAERAELEGWKEEDLDKEGSNAWHAHGSSAIRIDRAIDCWVKDVETFRHPNNILGAHLLSNGIVTREVRGLTLLRCKFQRPQYGGAGGNGYMFRLSDSNEALVQECVAEFSRHGLVLSGMGSSGNVFHRCTDRDTGRAVGGSGRYSTAGKASDHHMHFSHSNLFDQCSAFGSWFQAAYRPYGSDPKHNLTAAHSVYWNTRGEGEGSALVNSAQSRYGYVIGTWGSRPGVSTASLAPTKTDPVDHVEGIGKARTLEPQSLYLDQVRRAKTR